MPAVLSALIAFVAEHRRCGDLDGGLEAGVVRIACSCGAEIIRPRLTASGWRGDRRVARPSPTSIEVNGSKPANRQERRATFSFRESAVDTG